MEEDIQNYSPTVMFRGTPCTYTSVSVIRFSCWRLAALDNQKSNLSSSHVVHEMCEMKYKGDTTDAARPTIWLYMLCRRYFIWIRNICLIYNNLFWICLIQMEHPSKKACIIIWMGGPRQLYLPSTFKPKTVFIIENLFFYGEIKFEFHKLESEKNLFKSVFLETAQIWFDFNSKFV